MEKLKHVIEGKLNFSDMGTEDGGCFKYFKVSNDYTSEDGMYVC